MAFTLGFTADFGPSQTGLTLRAQLYDDDGTPNGAEITAGFIEVDSTNAPGIYYYKHTNLPDASRRSFVMYDNTDKTKRVAFVINPEEAENLDVKTSNVEIDTQDIQSRLPTALVSGRMDSDVGALQAGVIAAATFASDAIDAAALAADAANEIADALLKRDWTLVTGEASRSVLNALRFARNRWRVASGTLTVYKEDDSTSAWTAPVTATANADPITEVDPV